MAYFAPTSSADARQLLAALGIEDVEELFASIPAELRRRARIALPPGISEAELVHRFRELAATNRPLSEVTGFVGAGVYPYPIPAATRYVVARGEFLTAYTPYQPEISQGTLAAIFEFQTWVAELSGLPIANASLYDGATAVAEAVLMGLRVRRKARRVYLSDGLDPVVRRVVARYLMGQPAELRRLPLRGDGTTDWTEALEDQEPRIVVGGYPSWHGVLEDYSTMREALGEEAFWILHATDPHAWLLVAPPGELGVDVATAEGQPLAVPPSFGGPLLGLFATRDRYLRQMPGRLCGETVDRHGRRAYVLTLSTREQHIRREKATSNICSNQGVVALAATVTMSLLGPQGLRERALAATHNARRLEGLLTEHGWQRRHAAPYFHEFVVDHPQATALWEAALAEGIQLGVPLARRSPDDPGLLVCATAWHAEHDFERLATWLRNA